MGRSFLRQKSLWLTKHMVSEPRRMAAPRNDEARPIMLLEVCFGGCVVCFCKEHPCLGPGAHKGRPYGIPFYFRYICRGGSCTHPRTQTTTILIINVLA
jgi:hypothetical protein